MAIDDNKDDKDNRSNPNSKLPGQVQGEYQGAVKESYGRVLGSGKEPNSDVDGSK
jgi:hypothetical protein